EDLSVDLALIVIPDPCARPRVHSLYGQQVEHLPRFEDAPLWVDERDALALELKAGTEMFCCQLAMDFSEPPDLLESGHSQQTVGVIDHDHGPFTR
ncbi:MAG: hypothetical protein RLN85_18220, partial [Pseudomonadales bacterium]